MVHESRPSWDAPRKTRMKQAPDVRFIGLEPSEALASAAQDKAAKLDRFYPAIMACHVTVELAT